jgi:hypothetical protein
MDKRIEKIAEITEENHKVLNNRFKLGYEIGIDFTFDQLFALMDWQSEQAWNAATEETVKSSLDMESISFGTWLENFKKENDDS